MSAGKTAYTDVERELSDTVATARANLDADKVTKDDLNVLVRIVNEWKLRYMKVAKKILQPVAAELQQLFERAATVIKSAAGLVKTVEDLISVVRQIYEMYVKYVQPLSDQEAEEDSRK